MSSFISCAIIFRHPSQIFLALPLDRVLLSFFIILLRKIWHIILSLGRCKSSKMGMVNRDDYRFLKIADALFAVNQKVNLIGVILEYSIPKKSKGTGLLLAPHFLFRVLYCFPFLCFTLVFTKCLLKAEKLGIWLPFRWLYKCVGKDI